MSISWLVYLMVVAEKASTLLFICLFLVNIPLVVVGLLAICVWFDDLPSRGEERESAKSFRKMVSIAFVTMLMVASVVNTLYVVIPSKEGARMLVAISIINSLSNNESVQNITSAGSSYLQAWIESQTIELRRAANTRVESATQLPR